MKWSSGIEGSLIIWMRLKSAIKQEETECNWVSSDHCFWNEEGIKCFSFCSIEMAWDFRLCILLSHLKREGHQDSWLLCSSYPSGPILSALTTLSSVSLDSHIDTCTHINRGVVPFNLISKALLNTKVGAKFIFPLLPEFAFTVKQVSWYPTPTVLSHSFLSRISR